MASSSVTHPCFPCTDGSTLEVDVVRIRGVYTEGLLGPTVIQYINRRCYRIALPPERVISLIAAALKARDLPRSFTFHDTGSLPDCRPS